MNESNEANDVANYSSENDADNPSVQQLLAKISEMEAEKIKAREEFNHQRAKMKKLLLQKEGELKTAYDLKEQMHADLEEARRQLAVTELKLKNNAEEQQRKCEELEQIVHETVEESSSSRFQLENDVKNLLLAKERLEAELSEYRKGVHSANDEKHGERDPPPVQMLSHVTTFARKVLSELTPDSSSNTSKDNLEDSMRKAQEDAEVLRSLVVPLEEEIAALKKKLRETDEQLRIATGKGADEISLTDEINLGNSPARKKDNGDQESLLMLSPVSAHEVPLMSPSDGSQQDLEVFLSGSTSSAVTTALSVPSVCNVCHNYESQYQQAMQRVKELEKTVDQSEKTALRAKEDLAREHAFRQEMEVKWNEKTEQHKLQVAELQKKTLAAERALHELQESFSQMHHDVTEQLSRLHLDRQAIKKEIDKLQSDNSRLVGKHWEHSENLREQVINLPNTVEELQELLLRRHEELIAAKVSAETQEEGAELLRDELQMQQHQLVELEQELHPLRTRALECEALKVKYQQAKEEIANLNRKLERDDQEKISLEHSINDLQNQVITLQRQLDNNETVQKDFVKLSQSLQVQLEEFRQPNVQVRWQHEEDVDDCPNCHIKFGSSSFRKQNCRHCGRIFCLNCLSHKVPSGPKQRLSRVCNVCHTLLFPETAPYFSNVPPPTPD